MYTLPCYLLFRLSVALWKELESGKAGNAKTSTEVTFVVCIHLLRCDKSLAQYVSFSSLFIHLFFTQQTMHPSINEWIDLCFLIEAFNWDLGNDDILHMGKSIAKLFPSRCQVLAMAAPYGQRGMHKTAGMYTSSPFTSHLRPIRILVLKKREKIYPQTYKERKTQLRQHGLRWWSWVRNEMG